MFEDYDDRISGTASPEETANNHAEGWNLAIDRALRDIGKDDRFPPREEPYAVQFKFVAEMKVTNPGDIKTYGVVINPLGG